MRQKLLDMLAQSAPFDVSLANLYMAREVTPELNVSDTLRELDALARSAELDGDQPVESLNRYLFDTLGFRGNREDYYDPRNSFLSEVLARRMGIPILLSLVYIEIGRRRGLQVDGIALPGHFVVRVNGQYVDPFHHRVLNRAECIELAQSFLQNGMTLDARVLDEPATSHEIALRMLRNLKGAYGLRHDYQQLLWVCDILVSACPDLAGERRDRGLVYLNLQRYGPACQDLTEYLQQAPDALDADSIRGVLKQARTVLALMN